MLLQSGVLAAGAVLVIYGEITAGTMIAASIIMSRALAPIEQAIIHWRSFVGARSAFGRLQVVLSAQAFNRAPMRLPNPQAKLDVQTLVVTAPGQERVLLNGIQFSLRPGDGLGIVGPTGAGKSTLARALVGVWPVRKGAVRLDGATLDQWPPDQLGRAVGYLPQGVELLSGTVKQNIARFDPDPDPAQVVEAALQASAHDMILSLPNGYGTEIGDSGAHLSAGQRQRIGLARALYGRPALIVLDEPNSNLDSAGEEALTKAIASARARGATVIVVAHRLNALRSLDQLLFLKDGQQMALGPKPEILSKVLVQPAPRRRTDLAVVSD
jgi:ATP-binding cassette subfamily C protein